MANIKLPLKRLKPVALLALIHQIIAQMTGNVNFTAPLFSMAVMKTMADKLQTAIEAAVNGSRQARLHRNDVVTDTQKMLKDQADYVRSMCGGDATMLESSGFELSKTRQPIVKLEAPKYMRASIGNVKGEADLRWGAVHGTRIYQVWICLGDTSVEANWTVLTLTSQNRLTATALKTGSTYAFRVNALRSGEVGPLSAIATSLAA